MEKYYTLIEIALIILALGSTIIATVLYSLRQKEAKWLPGWQIGVPGDWLGVWIRRIAWFVTLVFIQLAMAFPYWLDKVGPVLPWVGTFVVALFVIVFISLHDEKDISAFQKYLRVAAAAAITLLVTLLISDVLLDAGIDIWDSYKQMGVWATTPGTLTYFPQLTMFVWFALLGMAFGYALNESAAGIWPFIVYNGLCLYPLFVASILLGIVATIILLIGLVVIWAVS